MKFHLFSFLLIFSLFACKEEPPIIIDLCENVVCNNGGVCDAGICDCPPEFMGITCDSLAPASAIKINKIYVTSFDDGNWDSAGSNDNSRPDICVQIAGNILPAPLKTDVIQNANHEIEHAFDVDWRIENQENQVFVLNFNLYDDDENESGTSEYMGSQGFFISNYRADKPSEIDFPLGAGGSEIGIRIELEWIFE
jgi:hypothetical protein